jgi:hypothetical protein
MDVGGDAASDAVAGDGAIEAAVDADASDAPIEPDTAVDTRPPSCADLFSSRPGFTSVCSDSPTRCVLEIDVDPDRTTCRSVCTGIGWICQAASGAASTTPRCDEPPAGGCDQNLRIQVCACRAP